MRIKAEFSIFYPNFWGQNKCLLTVFVKKHFGSSLHKGRTLQEDRNVHEEHSSALSERQRA